MGAKKHIRLAMIDHDATSDDLAKAIGMTPGSFRVKVSRDTMSFAHAEKIADVLNCDIVFIERTTGKIY